MAVAAAATPRVLRLLLRGTGAEEGMAEHDEHDEEERDAMVSTFSGDAELDDGWRGGAIVSAARAAATA